MELGSPGGTQLDSGGSDVIGVFLLAISQCRI